MSTEQIVVIPYSPKWPEQFQQLKDRIWPAVKDIAKSIEHVGSTSVEGLSAKPIIDLDIVVENEVNLKKVISAVEDLGYVHRGDLGIKGREAFKSIDSTISHHLYACIEENTALQNHLILRDHLRTSEKDRKLYSELKMKLAQSHSQNIDAYIEGKTNFILAILRNYGVANEHLSSIEVQNKSK